MTGQMHDEGAPRTKGTLYGDATAQKFKHASNDAQAKTRAATSRPLGAIDLPEGLEDLIEVFGGDSRAGVTYDDVNGIPTQRAHLDFHRTTSGVFHGISDEIEEHLS
jgi:hypothetical protein